MPPPARNLNAARKRRKPRQAPAPRRPSKALTNVLRMIGIIMRGASSAHTLARDLDVTERTVYRYASLIRSAGLPVYFDDRAGRYCFRLPPEGLDRHYAVPPAVGDAFGIVKSGKHARGARAPDSQPQPPTPSL